MMTPEFPDGREVILIANDITYQIGSFGPQEDLIYKVQPHPSLSPLPSPSVPMILQLASELSRKEGLPRIYIAANSGARIGLAEELKHLFHVAWMDPDCPDKVPSQKELVKEELILL